MIDDAGMARFIQHYDSLEDPELRAELLAAYGIHPTVLASWRRVLAKRAQDSGPASPAPSARQSRPVERPVRRHDRSVRRPHAPRRSGGPRSYQVVRARREYHRRTPRTIVVTITITLEG
ncbi:hypothetical protein [Kitasatospora aureofaciens]|uniref:hypothetical protein n=1 Tax=Kitasatospora aureofaciens TaxID=1894 RepID=UPI000AEC0752|nr:hypothetical protein [Kitasatospora aureofaciens]